MEENVIGKLLDLIGNVSESDEIFFMLLYEYARVFDENLFS